MSLILLVSFLVPFISSFEVDAWGDVGEHEDFLSELKKHGISIEEIPQPRPLMEFSEWRKDGVIIFGEPGSEQNLLDFINSGRSAVIFLKSDAEEMLNFIGELGLRQSDVYNEGLDCTYYSPMQDRKTAAVPCGGFVLETDRPAHAHYYEALKDEKGDVYAFALHGTNDARVIVFGGDMIGADIKTDAKGDYPDSAVHLALWAFRKSGVLRARDLRYVRLADGDVNPPELSISDDIVCTLIPFFCHDSLLPVLFLSAGF
jgi:hypothetical protein